MEFISNEHTFILRLNYNFFCIELNLSIPVQKVTIFNAYTIISNKFCNSNHLFPDNIAHLEIIKVIIKKNHAHYTRF